MGEVYLSLSRVPLVVDVGVPDKRFIMKYTYEKCAGLISDFVTEAQSRYGYIKDVDLEALDAWVKSYFEWFRDSIDNYGSITRDSVRDWIKRNVYGEQELITITKAVYTGKTEDGFISGRQYAIKVKYATVAVEVNLDGEAVELSYSSLDDVIADWGEEALSGLDANLTHHKIKLGMQTAKVRGKILGRPATTAKSIPGIFYEHYPKYKSGEINKKELAKLCKLSYPTVLRYVGIIEGGDEPHIGIFYIIGDKIYKSAEKVSDIESDTDGFKEYGISHYEYWDIVCQFAPEHRWLDYDYFPRGRITYSVCDDTYFIWIDRRIDDSEHRAMISGAFHLNGEHIVFETDDLYNC